MLCRPWPRQCWRRRAFCSHSQVSSPHAPAQPSCSTTGTPHPSVLSEIVDQVCSILHKQITWSPELEQVLAAAAPDFHSQLLFHVLKAQKSNPDLAWNLFHWAMRQRGFEQYTQGAYCRLIDIMARAGRYDAAWSLVDSIRNSGIPLTPVPFTTLICRYAGDARCEEAERTFRCMMQQGCKPNVHAFNALIRAQMKAEKVDAAFATFSAMRDQGCTPDVVSYTTLIKGLCELGKVDRASELLEEMRGNRCLPNKRTFIALIQGHLRAGQVQKALSTLDGMYENGCPPDIITYNSVLHWFCHKGQLEEALHLLDQMEEKQCVPDCSSYRALVIGFCTGSTMDAGAVVLKRVIEKGCNLDAFTCISLGNWLCGQAPADQAADILEWLMSRESNASGSSDAQLIECVFESVNKGTILSAVKQLMAKGLLPNKATCIGLTSWLFKEHEQRAKRRVEVA